jgi:hypothetical protein
MTIRSALVAMLVAVVALPLVGGVPGWSPGDGRARTWSSGGLSGLALRPAASAGAPLTVRLTSTLSSASARVGDRWTGIVVRPLAVGRNVIEAGTPVRGVVTGARAAAPGARAMLDLAVQGLTIAGRLRPLAAVTEAFLADIPRPLRPARIGRRVELLRGDDVVLKSRSVMVFTLDQRIAMR